MTLRDLNKCLRTRLVNREFDFYPNKKSCMHFHDLLSCHSQMKSALVHCSYPVVSLQGFCSSEIQGWCYTDRVKVKERFWGCVDGRTEGNTVCFPVFLTVFIVDVLSLVQATCASTALFIMLCGWRRLKWVMDTMETDEGVVEYRLQLCFVLFFTHLVNDQGRWSVSVAVSQNLESPCNSFVFFWHLFFLFHNCPYINLIWSDESC